MYLITTRCFDFILLLKYKLEDATDREYSFSLNWFNALCGTSNAVTIQSSSFSKRPSSGAIAPVCLCSVWISRLFGRPFIPLGMIVSDFCINPCCTVMGLMSIGTSFLFEYAFRINSKYCGTFVCFSSTSTVMTLLFTLFSVAAIMYDMTRTVRMDNNVDSCSVIALPVPSSL